MTTDTVSTGGALNTAFDSADAATSGMVTVENLALDDMAAKDGAGGSGGRARVGGRLFVASGGTRESDALTTVREKLLARAEALGFVLTEDRAVHLVTDDGIVIQPDSVQGDSYRFVVPEGTWFRLISRRWSPAEMLGEDRGRSQMGVCFRRIVLDDARDLPLESIASWDGWHGLERNEKGDQWRWTDGSARLPAASGSITIELAAATYHWTAPEAEDVAETRRVA